MNQEFTKRAFLNGRIDLAQTEAVIDLINAKTSRSSKIALEQRGKTINRNKGSKRQVDRIYSPYRATWTIRRRY